MQKLILRGPRDWWAKSFYTAADWREEADKYEELAKLAERDGDTFYAERARADAALCRQHAREKEVLT